MVDTIRIKRRLAAGGTGSPLSLANAELAYNEFDHILFYGEGSSGGNATNIVPIAGIGMSSNAAPVMNSGTVGVAGTLTNWARGDHVHPTDTSRLALSGGTMTGALILNANPASNLGAATKQYVDSTTGNYLPLTGGTVTGDITLSAAHSVVMNGPTAVNRGLGMQTNNNWRWTVYADGSAETTVAQGSNFVIHGFVDNTGTGGFDALVINRQTGLGTVYGDPTANLGIATKQYADGKLSLSTGGTVSGPTTINSTLTVTNTTSLQAGAVVTGALTVGTPTLQQSEVFQGPTNSQRLIYWQTGSSTRWTEGAGAGVETGTGDAGCDFQITRYHDNGSPIDSPITITRSTGMVTLLADPTSNLGVATKQYVDNNLSGGDAKNACRAASTVNVATLSGLLTIDGVVTVAGDRVLLKNQTTASQNGIYVASAGAWARSSDMNTWANVPGAYCFVEEGTTNANYGFFCTNIMAGGTIGITAITWQQFSASPSVTNPGTDGTATPGIATTYARSDHIHPTDLSRFAVAGGTITGSTTISTGNFVVSTGTATLGAATAALPGTADNSSNIATTQWVRTYTAAAPGPSVTVPLMNSGTVGVVGTLTTYAHGDHSHPTDTSRFAVTGGTLTGSEWINANLGDIGLHVNGPSNWWAGAEWNVTNATSYGVILRSDRNGVDRWNIYLGDDTAEGAPGSGMDFRITRANNAGTELDGPGTWPLFIARATGLMTVTGDPQTALGVSTKQYVDNRRLDQIAAPTATVSFNNQVISNLGAPVNPNDGANKSYVDSAIQGIDAKGPCLVATTGANITLSGTQTIDGVAVVVGNRVLVKDQTTTSANGIYVVAAGAWTRSTDMDAWTEVPAAFTFVEQGTANADTGWLCSSDPGGTIGTTPITWVQFSSAGQITAGNGLQKVGNVLNVLGTANRITVGTTVDIAANYVGQTSLITLGTVSTGTWNGSTIGVAYGGTGATSLTGYLQGNGTSAFTASATIPNTSISGLGTMSTQNATAVAITGGSIDGIVFDGGTF